MLQQTQVATARPYFERFLKAFPTIAALARADQQQVLRLWEGLGYYRRAQQVHRAAQQIVAEHGGVFPRDPEAVRRLPGIGRYTAGAILSIAFDAREPILEANTTRLFSRLVAFRGDPSSAPGQRLLWAMAEAVLPRRDVGLLNQALMELGSTLCVPRRPRCGECPLASLCRARQSAAQDEIPARKPKPPAEPRREAAVVVVRRGRALLVRSAEAQRWAGLWDFPRFAIRSRHGGPLRQELIGNVRRCTGVTVAVRDLWTTLKHGVTRFRITLECYRADYVSGSVSRNGSSDVRWVRLAELDRYPLNSTARRVARLLQRQSS
jgi:A/G-specific adenine glycosylase